MKKIFYAVMLAVLPVLAVSLASCSDDKDLPDVKIDIQVENATIADGTIYVVQGDTLNVTGLYVSNNEAGKSAALTNVRYYLDGFFAGATITYPFAIDELTTEETPVGTYDLGVRCDVLAPDKSLAFAVLNYPVKVVASVDQIPGAAVAKTASQVVSLQDNK